MHTFDRRTLLVGIAAAVATAALPRAAADPGTARIPAPNGVVTSLPGGGTDLALTVDDGASTEVVAAYAQFCRDSGTRLTFFVNGAKPSWTVNAAALRPMVDSGQIQVANHTWSHPYITKLSLTDVADQIKRNADFLRNTYGADGTPFFRPPYGLHTPDTDRVAADLGYHTITLWSGTVGDSRPISAPDLVAAAARSFQPQQIVLAHANLPTITGCYGQLLELIHQRNLTTVTLNDVFG
ncbi:polysaccharide deacetylase family protein [Mycobacterium sp. 1274761.0]|uniref:polysaccharide deacetylase family protein n=1 Tax=Mycobacterium sp. 1274761.0 TaxID=1834077 RepID=UPI0007FC1F6F|nr:polysaccharide deacetylase family protein [Mycobacterium sp. 1274761.0]OBK70662.1 polysaccharide deacetylase [Mycobacterium sp. 1274761.0]